MSADKVLDISRETVMLILKLSAPMLLASLVVGLIISLIQTITSIQEQTLTFVPKLIVTMLMIVLTGSWMMTSLAEFTTELFSGFGDYIYESTSFIGYFAILLQK